MSHAPGCHVCGGEPLFQWARLANEQEAAAQRTHIFQLQGRELSDDEIAARYGPARVVVTGCAEHAFGDDPEDEHSGADVRALTHEADCGGHGSCVCTSGAVS